jgi:hypothetical protein
MGLLDTIFVDVLGYVFEPVAWDMGGRVRQDRAAHAMAAGRIWGWDADLIRHILSIYDPLPGTAGVEPIYANVAESVCDDESIDWRDARSILHGLERGLGTHAPGEQVDVPSARRLCRRLAKEYRTHDAYLCAQRRGID